MLRALFLQFPAHALSLKTPKRLAAAFLSERKMQAPQPVIGMANRQIARDLQIDPTTIDHKLERLGRHSLLFLTQQRKTAKPATRIVFDGLETLEYSQFYAYHHNIVVEKGTNFILFFNDSELRRKGSMTKEQKPRRDELEEMYGFPDTTRS